MFFQRLDNIEQSIGSTQDALSNEAQRLRATIRRLNAFKSRLSFGEDKANTLAGTNLISLYYKKFSLMKKVTILTTPGYVRLIFTNFLPELIDKFNQCRISIESVEPYSIEAESLDKMDMCFLPYKLDNPAFSVEKIAACELQAFASEKYLGLNGTPKTLDDLQQHKIIKRTKNSDILSKHYQKPLEFNDDCPTFIEVPTGEAYLDLCIRGTGIGFMEKPLVRLNDNTLKEVDIDITRPTINRYLHINRNTQANSLIDKVEEKLTAIFH